MSNETNSIHSVELPIDLCRRIEARGDDLRLAVEAAVAALLQPARPVLGALPPLVGKS